MNNILPFELDTLTAEIFLFLFAAYVVGGLIGYLLRALLSGKSGKGKAEKTVEAVAAGAGLAAAATAVSQAEQKEEKSVEEPVETKEEAVVAEVAEVKEAEEVKETQVEAEPVTDEAPAEVAEETAQPAEVETVEKTPETPVEVEAVPESEEVEPVAEPVEVAAEPVEDQAPVAEAVESVVEAAEETVVEQEPVAEEVPAEPVATEPVVQEEPAAVEAPAEEPVSDNGQVTLESLSMAEAVDVEVQSVAMPVVETVVQESEIVETHPVAQPEGQVSLEGLMGETGVQEEVDQPAVVEDQKTADLQPVADQAAEEPVANGGLNGAHVHEEFQQEETAVQDYVEPAPVEAEAPAIVEETPVVAEEAPVEAVAAVQEEVQPVAEAVEDEQPVSIIHSGPEVSDEDSAPLDNLVSTSNKGRVIGRQEGDEDALDPLSEGDMARLNKDIPVNKPNVVPSRNPSQADDLKQIKGIGVIAETQLHGLGVKSYTQIAQWSDNDIQDMDTKLNTGGKIREDRWVEQAQALSGGSSDKENGNS